MITNSGVYQIKNMINGKVYIGSAKILSKRCWEHFNDPTKTNPHLHRSILKHGKKNFSFDVIQYCEDNTKENLERNEQFWMDLTECYNPIKGYNISKTAGKPSRPTKESAAKGMITKRLKGLNKITYPKLSTSKLGYLNPAFGKYGVNNKSSKVVYCYFKSTGLFYKKFESISEATIELKLRKIKMYRQSNGLYRFSFDYKERLEPYKRMRK